MEHCLCHPETALTLAPPPPEVPDPSRRFAAVRNALLAEFARTAVSGGYPIRQLATSHPQDLGNIIPEAWAVISEILAFYDVLLAKDMFIRSATTRVNLQRLADLLGYLPRPSVGSATHVALLGSQSDKPTSTAGLVLRSSLPSQVFEPDEIKTLVWNPGSLTITPIPIPRVSLQESKDKITFLLEAATAAPRRGAPVLFLQGHRMRATEILEVKPTQELDGAIYIETTVANPKFLDATLDPPLLAVEADVRGVSIFSPSQQAYVKTSLFNQDEKAFQPAEFVLSDPAVLAVLKYKPGGYGPADPDSPSDGEFSNSGTLVVLDGVYRNIKAGDLIIVQKGSRFSPHRVVTYSEMLRPIKEKENEDEDEELDLDSNADVDADVDEGPKIPLSVITVNPAIPSALSTKVGSDQVIIHYNMFDIGRLMQSAHSELTPALIKDLGGTVGVEGVHRQLDPSPYSGKWMLEDADGRGALVDATMNVGPRGKATLTITADAEWTTPLRVPVVAHPNILHVTRGETVRDETLGSGDPRVPSQSFELKKSPLTYLSAPDTTAGIRSTLEVRVDGVLWHEVRTFYGAGPNDHVYIVRQDDAERSTVTFGDGVRGSRLPAGLRNVQATYRFGAGAASPPFANITQISRGIPGLTRVRNPVAASGGGDREDASGLRRNVPASALVLGRCVSLTDFAARVAGMAGVLNSKVELAWDETMLAAVVKVWYVSATLPQTQPDPGLAATIAANLRAYAEPGTLVQATQAAPASALVTLRIEVAVAPGRSADEVTKAVHAALTDPESGMFTTRNAQIGGVLSRSAIVAAVLAVPGVAEVTAFTSRFIFKSGPFPSPGFVLPPGYYLDYTGAFAGGLTVKAVDAAQRACCDLGS